MYIEPLSTTVVNINGRYHARLWRRVGNGNKDIVDEMACESQLDIGVIIGIMLRWYCKLGLSPESRMARAARKRNSHMGMKGKIWYQKDLKQDVYKLHKNKI